MSTLLHNILVCHEHEKIIRTFIQWRYQLSGEHCTSFFSEVTQNWIEIFQTAVTYIPIKLWCFPTDAWCSQLVPALGLWRYVHYPQEKTKKKPKQQQK